MVQPQHVNQEFTVHNNEYHLMILSYMTDVP